VQHTFRFLGLASVALAAFAAADCGGNGASPGIASLAGSQTTTSTNNVGRRRARRDPDLAGRGGRPELAGLPARAELVPSIPAGRRQGFRGGREAGCGCRL